MVSSLRTHNLLVPYISIFYLTYVKAEIINEHILASANGYRNSCGGEKNENK